MALPLSGGEHRIDIGARLSPLRRGLLWLDGVLVLASLGGLAWALGEALKTWQQPDLWRRLQQNAMAQDYSWEHQIVEYEKLYARLERR